MPCIVRTRRFANEFRRITSAILERSPHLVITIVDRFDSFLATIEKFPLAGVPRVMLINERVVEFRDSFIDVGSRRLTVRYFVDSANDRILLSFIWIDGQDYQ